MIAAAEARARGEMLDQGWQPLPGQAVPLAMARLRHSEVELLSASRPFSLYLASGVITGEAPPAAKVKEVAGLLARELGRYPPSFLVASRFKRVLMCTHLREGDVPIPSLPNYERSLLLDVSAPPAFLRRLVHHEVFHFADYADDHQLQRDPEWEKLNDHYFTYGVGGRFMREPGSARLNESLPGFLSHYATAALEEDKAEVFAFVMSAPVAVRRVAARDRIVRAKVAAMKKQVSRLAPEMGAAFWASVEAGQR
ncbi:MAG: hypothetical protein JSV65_01605 [Armatimonadota bacterium]|nr:MAG: hypothetical protein JSV65_01605 [Armatimonadota bacterium]